MLMCIDEQRNNSNVILAYRIQDTVTGETRDFDAKELKNYIAKGKLNIVNLKLTSDGRLYKIRVEQSRSGDTITYYDAGTIGVKPIPKYSNMEQENINKIMRSKQRVEANRQTMKTMSNIGGLFSSLFGGKKKSDSIKDRSGHINESSVADEYNSGYSSAASSNSGEHGHSGFGAFMMGAIAGGMFSHDNDDDDDDNDDDGDDGDFDGDFD